MSGATMALTSRFLGSRCPRLESPFYPGHVTWPGLLLSCELLLAAQEEKSFHNPTTN